MARGKRTPEETKAKVTELKISNPELSSYDISERLKGTEWEVSADTVQDIIKELPQLAVTEKGKAQIDRLDAIISGIEAITAKTVTRIQDQEEVSVKDVKDLNDVAKNNWERKRLLEGSSTSNDKITIEWQV